MALAEGAEGGFAGVYPVLKEMEERGQVRRGYFVAGLGAAQFALPGAVDRLRDERRLGPEGDPGAEGAGVGGTVDRWGHDGGIHAGPEEGVAPPLVLAACDPAQPYGAALAWPDNQGRPSRAVGAHVVLRAGVPLAFLERGAKSLTLFEGADDDPAWIPALGSLVADGVVRSIEVQKIDGVPTAEQPARQDLLLTHGFKPGYRGPVLRG